ncbi:hypothetical protein [Candidatus Microthrix parvicella]|uniref:hypothetical protein n=1 Tax=Candidatus Neomicrothrix parvicella TaxID=41950 RepID=UPI0012FD6B22|nr:hypothetical protein [Candidatus Microthrix parvicella]
MAEQNEGAFHNRCGAPTLLMVGNDRVAVEAASAIQVDNGVAVKLWLTDDAVSVQLPRRLTWRELLSSRVQDVVLVDAETLEIDGSTFRIDPPDDAEDFFAAVRSQATEIVHAQEAAATRSAALNELTEPFGSAGDRWQYAVVSTGAFNTSARLTYILSATGRAGWELVTVYDKASNWLPGIENGFMLLRRRVPAGVEPASWAIQYNG